MGTIRPPRGARPDCSPSLNPSLAPAPPQPPRKVGSTFERQLIACARAVFR